MRARNRPTFMSKQARTKPNSGLTPFSWKPTMVSAGAKRRKSSDWSRNIEKSYWRRGMSTSASKKKKLRRAYVPTTALAKSVEFDNEMMRVVFTDGRILSVPLVWFPVLRAATPEERLRYEIGGGGVS